MRYRPSEGLGYVVRRVSTSPSIPRGRDGHQMIMARVIPPPGQASSLERERSAIIVRASPLTRFESSEEEATD